MGKFLKVLKLARNLNFEVRIGRLFNGAFFTNAKE